ncbi:MAG: 50S ribosomal protein L19, partial [Candidatus Binatia bacterium]
MNIIDKIEAEQSARELPAFRPGDTLRVHAKIVEGDKERIQIFEGVCIRRSAGGNRERLRCRAAERSARCFARARASSARGWRRKKTPARTASPSTTSTPARR